MADFASMWEYRVRPEKVEEFLDAYRPDGRWVRLFRKSAGYVRTELLRDRDDSQRFMTVDFWRSREAWERFQQEHRADYEKLDKVFSSFTVDERHLGAFETVP